MHSSQPARSLPTTTSVTVARHVGLAAGALGDNQAQQPAQLQSQPLGFLSLLLIAGKS
jgi:hypothetical protein